MKKYYFFILFQFIFFELFSQLTEADISHIKELKKTISETSNDSLKIELLKEWDNLIYASDSELDKKINEQIIEICLKNKKSLKYQKYFQIEYASGLNILSLIAMEESEMFVALDNLLEAYKIAKKHHDKVLESKVLNNIGIVYKKIGDNKKALEYYLRSSKLINDSVKDANTFNNLGLCYSDLNDFVNANKYFKISLRISKKSNNRINEANTIGNIADIFYKQKNYILAKEKYLEAQKIYVSLKNNFGYSYTTNKIGYCYYFLHDYKNAIKKSKISYDLSLKTKNIDNLLQSSKNLYLSYKQLNKKDELVFYLEEYHEYYKKGQEAFYDKNVMKKQFEIEFEQKKIQANLKFEKKIEISKEKSKKQALVLYFTIGILVVVFLFLILIFNRFKITQKQKVIIEQQKRLFEEKNREITDSITYAKRIQSAILPQEKFIKEHLPNSFIIYKPKDIVAGDFYWFEVINDLIFIAAADCTGHGVPGAMVSVVCHNALNRSLKEFSLSNPAQILNKTREIVVAEFEKSHEDVQDGMDISLCVLNKKELKLYWSGAHNPLWILRNKELIEYKGDKQPIGKFAYATDFTSHEIPLLENDEIFIATDGFQDQFGGEKGKKFKVSQLKDILVSNAEKSIFEKEKTLHLAFDTWKKDFEQVDDVCLIGLKL